MPELRPFQSEDFNAVILAHQTHQRVLGRGATGLGKAVICAALAGHYARFGRVMILVDVGKLVRQLAETVEWWTGAAPGIEMAESFAHNGERFGPSDRIVCSTVQSQYAGAEGKERFRRFNPDDFACIILDETETFLAEGARRVVDYYLKNPAIRLFGCTATPFRSDGTPMANLFDHVAFDRDIRWGIDHGYLVPVRQGFVQVSVDFSTLKINSTDEEGDRDFSAEDIASKLEGEGKLLELAKGIKVVAEKRRTIVVCPTVAVSIALAEYLCGQEAGCAKAIFGELSDEQKTALFDGHRRGDFQFLISVMMLTKGFDDPEISCVVNCRKTKSKRLYQQIMGRGTRVLKGIVEGVEPASERRRIIAASAKRETLMVNMVGVNENVRDVSVVDILGNADLRVNDRAMEIMRDTGVDLDAALAMAEDEVAESEMAEQLAAECRAEIEDRHEEAAKQREAENSWRRQVDVEARVDVEWTDDLNGGGGSNWVADAPKATGNGPTDKQINALIRFGVAAATARGYSKRQASAVLSSYFDKLKGVA